MVVRARITSFLSATRNTECWRCRLLAYLKFVNRIFFIVHRKRIRVHLIWIGSCDDSDLDPYPYETKWLVMAILSRQHHAPLGSTLSTIWTAWLSISSVKIPLATAVFSTVLHQSWKFRFPSGFLIRIPSEINSGSFRSFNDIFFRRILTPLFATSQSPAAVIAPHFVRWSNIPVLVQFGVFDRLDHQVKFSSPDPTGTYSADRGRWGFDRDPFANT